LQLTICTTIYCCLTRFKEEAKSVSFIHTTKGVPLYHFLSQRKTMANYNNKIFIVPAHSVVALDKTTPNLLTTSSMDASHAQGSQQQPSQCSSSGQQLTLMDISVKLDQIRNAIVSLENRLNELAKETNQRWNEPNERLNEGNQRLNETNGRLNEPNERLNEGNQRLNEPNGRLNETNERLNERIGAIERRLDLVLKATLLLFKTHLSQQRQPQPQPQPQPHPHPNHST
jgi:predicted transcriptional regulator